MSDIENEDLTDEEAALLARLGETIDETNMVPPWLTRFAYESQRLVTFEGELAEILSDSLTAPAGVRSTSGLRTIEFGVGSVRIRLELQDGSVRGSVDPTASELRLVTIDAETSTETEASVDLNDRGFFTFALPAVQFRLVATVDDQQIRTDWISQR